jgi:hypothetical protein
MSVSFYCNTAHIGHRAGEDATARFEKVDCQCAHAPLRNFHSFIDTDMNSELIAHGYANALSGMFGGK